MNQMDLQDWELLHDDGFLEIHDDDGGNKIYSRKNHHHSNSVFHTNYFMPPPEFVETTAKVPNQLLPIPIHLQPPTVLEEDRSQEHDVVKKESLKIPVEIPESFDQQQDPAVSQVFFKKMNETDQFVDIKVESPRSSSRGIMIEGSGGGAFQFEEKKVVVDPCNDDHSQIHINNTDEGGLNIWKWSLSGICSFGVAVCIILLSTHHNKNQKLQFQIYTSDKRMKQVVHRANKLKEAMSAARGAAITRARITVGGYYDASSL